MLGNSPKVRRSHVWGVPLLLEKCHALRKSISEECFYPKEIFNAKYASDTINRSTPKSPTESLGEPKRFHKR